MSTSPLLLAFGAIADVQHADRDDFISPECRKRYRDGLEYAVDAAERFQKPLSSSGAPPAFVLQLGDIVDNSMTDRDNVKCFDAVMNSLRGAGLPILNVVGNHCFAPGLGEREELLRRLEIEGTRFPSDVSGPEATLACYSKVFETPTSALCKFVKLIVLDGSDVSTYGWNAAHAHAKQAEQYLDHHSPADLETPQAYGWNAGVSSAQIQWVRAELRDCQERGGRAILACHYPVLAAAAAETHLLWNGDEVVSLLEEFAPPPSPSSPGDEVAAGVVMMFISGHYHIGGYAFCPKSRVHHLTVQGVLEMPAQTNNRAGCATVAVTEKMIFVDGFEGHVPSRQLRI